MRNERKIDAVAHHGRAPQHLLHGAVDQPMFAYLEPITVVGTLTIDPGLKTAGEIVHPDHTVQARSPLAEAS